MTTLHLTRRPRETINIGDNITVTVVKVRGNQVHVMVNAPPSVAVDREEIYIKKQHERVGCHCGPDNPGFSDRCPLHYSFVQVARV